MNLRNIHGCESPTVIAQNHVQKYSGNSALAVFIENACKRYEHSTATLPILQNFGMNVKKGSIYGLLGSSGCGKTTVVSCIVGLQKFDSGELFVFGQIPGRRGSGIPGKRLGYMPQELALYNHLSMQEVVMFYGRIYCMTSGQVNEQWNFLKKLLNVSSKFKLIGELSGGQQRLASLALALIHSPELLVLDEPTVGLDPLIRKGIWDYLYLIVKKMKTTIIITTHCIEEARLSTTVGVMRDGRLLVEDAPLKLLKTYNSELLEDVVLHLCHRDMSQRENCAKNLAVTKPNICCQAENQIFKSNWKENEMHMFASSQCKLVNGTFHDTFDCEIFDPIFQPQRARQDQCGITVEIFPITMCCDFLHSFQRIYGFTTVILLTFLRYPVFLVSILFIPSMQCIVTILTMGSPPRGLPLGIVNHELVNWTQECASSKHFGNYCDLSALSCKYINLLKGDDLFVLNSYKCEADAHSQAQLGNILGYLVFPANYSQHSLDFAEAEYFALNESIVGSRIHAHLDYSRMIMNLC